MAGYIYLPVVTEETMHMAETLNQGRIDKMVNGTGVQVGTDPVQIVDDGFGLTALFIAEAFGSLDQGLIRIEGLHKPEEFEKVPRAGKSFSIPGGRIKKVWVKSCNLTVPARLEFGPSKEPYTILASGPFGSKKKTPRLFRSAVLKNLTAADKLFIVAHGYFESEETEAAGRGSLFIGAAEGAKRDVRAMSPTWVGGKHKLYSPEKLAEELKKEGLPKNFRTVHLFACGSGLECSDTMRSFAQRLKAALAPGFPHVVVFGYRGNVTPNYNIQAMPPAGAGGKPFNPNPSPNLRGMTATKHKGVRANGVWYPASSQRVMF
jgi:hypothetical protein